ncbi:hypothetical protein KRP22_014298 [Phytophthora ramorum]|nr:hypothetical protein KRP22_9102 [Phytophthora ramorum]
MSFSLVEEDKMATLEELFAFIDCSNGPAKGTQDGGDWVCEDPLTVDRFISSPANDPCLKSADIAKKTSKRRRIRIGWSSSTGLQRRKRAELLYLQQHVQDLETYLQQLKWPCTPDFDSVPVDTPIRWKEIAGAQFVKRLESEETNRVLKTMLSKNLQKESEPDKSTRRKRKKLPGASTKLQRRKKAEILGLRAQTQELEGKLEQLKRFNGSSSWLTIATTQYEERLKSEMANQQLRAVLTEYMKTNRAFQEVFQKQTSLGNLGGIFGKQYYPTTTHPSGGTDTSLAVIGALESQVEGLYLDSGAVFQPSGVPTASTSLHGKHGRQQGRVFEINSTSWMSCSMREASAMMWRELLTVRKYNDKSYRFFRQRVPASVEKDFTMVLRSASSVKEINGLSFVRKIEEPNRVVLVGADCFLLPTEGLQFRVQRWTIITRSGDASQPKSVVRTLLQLYAEYSDGFTSEKEDLQEAEDFVLETLGGKLQEYIRWQERVFTQEARAAATDSVPMPH